MSIVQFAPFSSLVQPSFWHELTNLKIDVLKLSDDAQPITGSYATGRTIKDRETGKDVALGTTFSVGAESFRKNGGGDAKTANGSVSVSGLVKNYNTIEEFKAADKTALFNAEADKIWESILTTRSTSLLTHFVLLTFADLKKYKYFYWFAFPAFVTKPAWEIDQRGWVNVRDRLNDDSMKLVYEYLRQSPKAFFLVRETAVKNVELGNVEDLDTFFKDVPSENRIVGFTDPSAMAHNPGWPLRNLLAYLHKLHPSVTSSPINVLCWRDADLPSSNQPGEASAERYKSRFGVISLGKGDDVLAGGEKRPSAVGWEKNVQAKLGPRMVDLGPMMDPARLADQAVDLNLKLMRWRILPSLDLEKVAGTRCLLLGAGTLGCYVARTLMAWGVRTITLVDSARVSFSNPVRQPLFEFEDCLGGGKPKAACAAERLKKIFPGVNAKGYEMNIPMPGHPIPPAEVEQTRKDVATLESLVEEHDVVFLLMDSRESRWLPTVLGAAKRKIVMNAALGFDTFIVMRHGAREATTSSGTPRLGCYYCNDIVAPADSLTDRTLDQMCTVTRPGLASIASSTAVELLVALLQHPDGVRAPAPPPQTANHHELPNPESSGSVLGLIPHQLRGYLAQFRNLQILGAAFDKCTGCGETVLKAYEEHGFDMMLKAFNEEGYLEKLTGLDRLYVEGENALESVDWDEEDE